MIEAIACGLPVLGYKAGVLEEIVGTQCGVCIPFENEKHLHEGKFEFEVLEDALNHIVINRDSFKESCRKVALDKFSIDKMAAQYDKVMKLVSSK